MQDERRQQAPGTTRQENERHFVLPQSVREVRLKSRQPSVDPTIADPWISPSATTPPPGSEATAAGDEGSQAAGSVP